MCGIAGRIEFDGAGSPDAWLKAACTALAHRGPDAAATHHINDGGTSVAYAHRRLRVIDLDPSADQPMHNRGCVRAGRATPLTIVFNGEIYNYLQLRRDLANAGHVLDTRSDTEAILHLYEEYGAGCVERLQGMFAFAIWDHQRRELFCARDRLGKKPLYYRHDGRRFWFASEAKAIVADPAIERAVNPDAIRSYLQLGYVPSPASAFAGISRLPAGWSLVVSESGILAQEYWRVTVAPDDRISEADALAELDTLLAECVQARMVSDVPLGALLSGGIDSSLVVGYMSRSAKVRTFSIGFDDADFDERRYADEVARRFGTDHHRLVVSPRVADVLPRLAWHVGEPFADSSLVPTYYVSQLARTEVTVVLTGDGGDESFGGYRRYRALAMIDRFARMPAALRQVVARVDGAVPENAFSRGALYDLRRFARGAATPVPALYTSWFGFFADPDELLTMDFAAAGRGAGDPMSAAFERYHGAPSAVAAMGADLALYLPDDILVKVDIASMAHGLEVRAPLLDHRIVEFGARLPLRLKLRGGGKHLLRALAARWLPAAITARRKKGFAVPLDRWLRHDLAPMLRDVLLSQRARERGYFRAGAVERLLDAHVSGRESHAHRLWALLMLELWHQQYIDVRHQAVPSFVEAGQSG
jgi:asparagine synthase (glutamine-hydrolysing)